jgi:hypothetical protein
VLDLSVLLMIAAHAAAEPRDWLVVHEDNLLGEGQAHGLALDVSARGHGFDRPLGELLPDLDERNAAANAVAHDLEFVP